MPSMVALWLGIATSPMEWIHVDHFAKVVGGVASISFPSIGRPRLTTTLRRNLGLIYLVLFCRDDMNFEGMR